jgi:hypothetical protein
LEELEEGNNTSVFPVNKHTGFFRLKVRDDELPENDEAQDKLSMLVADEDVQMEVPPTTRDWINTNVDYSGEKRNLSATPKTNDLLITDHVNDLCVLLEFPNIGKAEGVPTRKHGDISLSDKQFLYDEQRGTMEFSLLGPWDPGINNSCMLRDNDGGMWKLQQQAGYVRM